MIKLITLICCLCFFSLGRALEQDPTLNDDPNLRQPNVTSKTAAGAITRPNDSGTFRPEDGTLGTQGSDAGGCPQCGQRAVGVKLNGTDTNPPPNPTIPAKPTGPAEAGDGSSGSFGIDGGD